MSDGCLALLGFIMSLLGFLFMGFAIYGLAAWLSQ